MPAKVYTLTETTDRAGYVLGVFADRTLAVDAAMSHARWRIERCLASDTKSFGGQVPEGTYSAVMTAPDEHAKLVIVHQPSGETDPVSWQIWPFDELSRHALWPSAHASHDLPIPVGPSRIRFCLASIQPPSASF